MKISKLYMSVLFLNLSNELINMGLIVWAGSQSVDPIKQTAWVAFWAATGYIIAIFLNLSQYLKVSRDTLLLLTIFSSGLIFIFPQMSVLWGCSILIRNALGQVTYARFTTVLPELVKGDDLPKVSKNVQLAGNIGNAGSVIISPFISSKYGVLGVYLCSLFFIILVYLIVYKIIWPQYFVKSSPIKITDHLSSWLNLTAFMLIITWAIYGIFFVIEIPLLQSRINASPFIISSILFLNILSNIFTTKLISENSISKNSKMYFFTSCIGLTLFTVAYLKSYSIMAIILSVFLLGFFNSIMNFSVFISVQKIISNTKRESFFLGYRLAAEVGILTGVIIVYFFRRPEAAIYNKLIIFSLIVLMFQILLSLKKEKTYE